MGTVNTMVYPEEWAVKLQERLDAPTNWKAVCRVEYTNTRVFNNPYITDPTVQNLLRGTAYTMQEVVETNESITISNGKVLAQFIDRADLAQSDFTKMMDLADRQGVLLNEGIESAMLASHADWTNFDNASIGGSAGNITVSATNIDDIIRGIKREIREAGGESLMNRKGVFIVWRAADFEILESFMQANGFMTADAYLKEGSVPGLRYMGVEHYVSNFHTSGHVFAGVKDTYHLGICKETYGQIMVNDKDPGNISGVSVVSRIDYAFKAWTKTATVLFDVLVA